MIILGQAESFKTMNYQNIFDSLEIKGFSAT